jgi:hypothetical protein
MSDTEAILRRIAACLSSDTDLTVVGRLDRIGDGTDRIAETLEGDGPEPISITSHLDYIGDQLCRIADALDTIVNR